LLSDGIGEAWVRLRLGHRVAAIEVHAGIQVFSAGLEEVEIGDHEVCLSADLLGLVQPKLLRFAACRKLSSKRIVEAWIWLCGTARKFNALVLTLRARRTDLPIIDYKSG
jgi:hypothetical protein